MPVLPDFPDSPGSPPVALDGGLGTQLEARGHDLSSAMWSARLLVEQPGEIAAVHREYFDAGARVAISCSYQASFSGFERIGIDRPQAVELLTRSVRLAIEARDAAATESPGVPRWVAASVGPYGATLADGSEYRGDDGLSVSELRRWHRDRLAVLADAGADLLALETIPSLREAEALVAEVDRLDVPAWLSVTIADGRMRSGDALRDVFALAASNSSIVAAGVNCSSPGEVEPALRAARGETDKPLLAYPNSGERWDADARRWTGNPRFDSDMVHGWLAAGASLVGGCCRVGPAEIAHIADVLDTHAG
ncbi:homocysteine S-methyltransferase [Planctomonas psychrotolerans]|uniref:homocysteine S-methyltransferase n=1 Tax=Planctomonas psychrotolerans TaxID=2528712 RepID=UPI00123BB562|nr:homocysteine S-methyltransferase [Planctomonas psychrotolerans]